MFLFYVQTNTVEQWCSLELQWWLGKVKFQTVVHKHQHIHALVIQWIHRVFHGLIQRLSYWKVLLSLLSKKKKNQNLHYLVWQGNFNCGIKINSVNDFQLSSYLIYLKKLEGMKWFWFVWYGDFCRQIQVLLANSVCGLYTCSAKSQQFGDLPQDFLKILHKLCLFKSL